MEVDRIICGDALEVLRTLPDESVHCCVTSPPYWGLRDYGIDGQIGLERTPEEYVAKLVEIFREVRRVLRADGTLWLNLGDCYAQGKTGGQSPKSTLTKHSNGGSSSPYLQALNEHIVMRKPPLGLKPKDLVGIPWWRVAFALQADGWWLRSDIIWHKPNCLPESVKDRPTKAHEYIFLLAKSQRYYYDQDAIREPYAPDSLPRVARGRSNRHKWANGGPGNHTLAKDISVGCTSPLGRNKRTVWTVPTKPFKGAHFAVFPPDLIRPCILAGCPPGGIVLDPFFGAGTVGVVALEEGRHFIGIELNPDYCELARERISKVTPKLLPTGGRS